MQGEEARITLEEGFDGAASYDAEGQPSIVSLMQAHRTACATKYKPKISPRRQTSPAIQINHYGL